MLSHRLEELASFVRDLGSECTCLIIHGDILIAGSKNGKIVSWNIKDGHEIWSLEVDGPISDIEVSDLIYLTASAELHAIEIENGSLKWTQDIGGSSDLIKVDKESIWVTSSLYEIEVQDYTETTLFKFDKNSKLIKSIVFEERPWFMAIEGNDLILGIGRPRCGYLIVNSNNEINHEEISGDSPITLGIKTKSGFLLGHSNGTMTEIKNKNEQIIKLENSPITSIIGSDDFWCLGDNKGAILSSNNWKKNISNRIDCLIEVNNLIWAAAFNNENRIYLLDRNNGDTKYIVTHDSRIRLMKHIHGKIAISDENGKIILLEEEIVFRRLGEIKETSQNQEKRDLLKKRLRELRK